MGSRVVREAPKDVEKKKKKASDARTDAGEKKRKDASSAFIAHDIIEATQNLEGLNYRPRTSETREVYSLILAAVHSAIGDQAQDVVRSAADVVLEILKDDKLKDFDKKRDIDETLLTTVSGEIFSQLLSLAKKVTDYGEDDEQAQNLAEEKRDMEIDDEVGVAVVFDEDEQDEEDEEENFELRDESDESDEEGQGAEALVDEEAVSEDELVVGSGSRRTDAKPKADQDIVSPHAIDGFWVQRQISEIYPDPVTAADKASAVLSILGSESSLRDCENQLMELFDYQSFHVITKFLKNR